MRHKYLTPWQCLGHALQWWDNRPTLNKKSVYTARIAQVSTSLYRVAIQAPWGSVFGFQVDTVTKRWSMFSPSHYHYRTGVLGLYKTSDMRQLFRWAQRIMEHSATI